MMVVYKIGSQTILLVEVGLNTIKEIVVVDSQLEFVEKNKPIFINR